MATKFKKDVIATFPKYIRFGEDGCAMRLTPVYESYCAVDERCIEYHRDAGLWGVGVRLDSDTGKLYSVFEYANHDISYAYLNDVELISTTYEDWKEDNQGYLYKNTRAYNVEDDIEEDIEEDDNDWIGNSNNLPF